jgi:hypothetical protein
MPTITLAKALKLKNRLTGRLSNVGSDIIRYNSVIQEQVGKVDIPNLIKTREQIVESLIGLKIAIFKANVPIQELLVRIGEAKAELTWLASISTKDGAERHGYQNTDVFYAATIKKADVDRLTMEIEAKIDRIQDEIDAFNAQTTVEVSKLCLELAGSGKLENQQ